VRDPSTGHTVRSGTTTTAAGRNRAANEENREITVEKGHMKIVGFLCTWCCYAGADLAGVSRLQYPPDMKVIRVMCSTRIDPTFIFRAFRRGADGVFIGGCHPGDCHYLTGNYHTLNKINAARRILGRTGIHPDRLRLEWISAAEGERFASEVTDFIETCRKLGPSELAGDDADGRTPSRDAILDSLRAAERAFSGFRLRSVVGKQKKIEDGDNVYDESIPEDRWKTFFDEMLDTEYLRGRILVQLDISPASVKTIAAAIHEEPSRVLEEVNILRKRGSIRLDRVDGRTPIYAPEVRM